MIKGRGFLATALSQIDNEKFYFYANGISNSHLTTIPQNSAEENEVRNVAKIIGSRTFVYISTSQVNVAANHSRPYVGHKLKMENIVKEVFPRYLIVRTSNIVGHNPWNTNTLFNFLYNALKEDKEIFVNELTARNILDVDDFVILLKFYFDLHSDMQASIDIVNPQSYTMREILNGFEECLGKKFSANIVAEGFATFKSPVVLSEYLVNHCSLNMSNYLNKTIKKYYVFEPQIAKNSGI